jgi:hypothetical protein
MCFLQFDLLIRRILQDAPGVALHAERLIQFPLSKWQREKPESNA